MFTNDRFLEDAAIVSKHPCLIHDEILRKAIVDHIIEPLKRSLDSKVLGEILQERKRQKDELKLDQENDDQNDRSDWVAHICVYNGRAAHQLHGATDVDQFRENMIKVAALAVAAVEAYDAQYCPED